MTITFNRLFIWPACVSSLPFTSAFQEYVSKPCRVRAPSLRVDPGLVDIFLIPDRRIGTLVDTDETLQLSTNAAAKADLRKMITALSAPDSVCLRLVLSRDRPTLASNVGLDFSSTELALTLKVKEPNSSRSQMVFM